ncbi:MAG TPA: GAF domain-containing protein [Candidatus Acidoferrales bacterium]|nr:GAF domain-containing protein [Candidatus Acidoferrales bacterium]
MARQSIEGHDESQEPHEQKDARTNAASTLARSALGLLGCNACEIFAYEESLDSYVSVALAADDPRTQSRASLGATALEAIFPEGIDVLTVDDTRALEEPLQAVTANLGAVSALILRIGLGDRRLAIIICAYRWSRHLSVAGTVVPRAFASIAATSLDLARRAGLALDRADRLASLLDSASRFAGELDLETLFATIHQEVGRHMDAPSFFVALQNPDSGELRTEYAIESGMRLHSDALPGREGLAASVLASNRPALVEWSDVYAKAEGDAGASGSILLVPMRLSDRIIGVMSAQSKHPNAYSQHHVEFLLEVAEQAATAIQNAGMLREERRRAAELTMLHRVAVLTSAETQLDRIMAAVVLEAASIFHADAVSISLENEHGDFEVAATYGLSDDYQPARREPGAWLRAWYGNPPTERFAGPDQIAAVGQPALLAAEGVKTMFFIPLVYRGKLVGSLELYGRQSIVRLSSGEARLAQVFADQVAAAMHRAAAAQTLAERIEEYDIITRVGSALASNLPANFSSVLELLREQMGYGHLAVFSVHGDPLALHLHTALGYDVPAERRQLALDQGLVGLVASSGEMAYIPDVLLDQRYLSVAPNIRSFIAYPLTVERRVLGVLAIESVKADGFVARDRRVLAAIADQMALAISNARQYATATERLSTLGVARSQAEEYARYLERRHEELELLGTVGSAVNSTLNLGRMLATAAEKIAAGLHVERCVISVFNEEQTETEVAADAWSGGSQIMVGARFAVRENSAVLRLLRQRHTVASEDVRTDPRFDGNRQEMLELQLRGAALAPITSEGQLLGTLVVGETSAARRYTPEQLEVLETIATQLALGVRNARLYGRARERANEDSLTGLFNHRYLHGRLEQELARTQRSGQPLAIALFDLNNFKAFNDNYGHQAGDEVLRFMATVLHMSLRATDIAGRYGGDEFLVILPQSDEQGAHLLLERVRRKIEEQAGTGLLPIPIKLSAGVAVYPRDADNKSDLIARADAAMYADKRRAP